MTVIMAEPTRRWKDGDVLWAENDFCRIAYVPTDDPAKLAGWRMGLHGPEKLCVSYITLDQAKLWESLPDSNGVRKGES
jgi:hypothetical protein